MTVHGFVVYAIFERVKKLVAQLSLLVGTSCFTACGESSEDAGFGNEPEPGSAGTGAQAGNGAAPSSGGADSGEAGAGAGAMGGTNGAPVAGTGGSGAMAGSAGSAPVAGTGGDPVDLDPPPGEYGERAELPQANSEMAVAEVLGKIYVVGGYPSSRVYQDTVQVYDVETDTWDFGPPLPMPIHHPVVIGALGKLYSLGGQTNDGDTDRTLVHDPVADTPWTDLEPMPTARGAGAAAVIDDRIYVVGGRPPGGNAFEVYDIGDDEWTELPDLPQEFPERNHLIAAAIAGKVYVAGGRYDGGGFGSPMTDSLDVFDPALGMWTEGQAMLRPRGGLNGVVAYGCFYTWGGEGANIGEPNNVFPDHDVYDPLSDMWTALPDLPTPVHGVTGAAFVDGLIYMPGGGTEQGGNSGSTIFQVFRPAQRCE